jgi:hypothetical protein
LDGDFNSRVTLGAVGALWRLATFLSTRETRMSAKPREWDVFISHASEDKDTVARPLAESLQSSGVRVWFDEFTLRVGDSLSRSIDYGLANSRFGIVILSEHFFSKQWPQRELGGLVARAVDSQEKVILPVWHGITKKDIAKFSPTLADILALSTEQGIDNITIELVEAIKPQTQNGFAGISKSDLVIRVERVAFLHEPKPLLWQAIETKSRNVMKLLYESILQLGYTPDTFTCWDEDQTLVQYRAIPPRYLRELKNTVDEVLGKHITAITWRENKNIGFNLWVKLGKDIGD